MKKKAQKSQLLIGYAISGLGDQFYIFAIPLLLLSKTHSSVIMGLLTAVEYLPTALFGLTIGPLFDIWSRKKVMLVSLLMQAILVICAPLLIIKNAPLVWTLAAIFFFGTFDLITWTGYQILIAEAVKPDELSTVSGQVGLISAVQKTFGPGIAAIIIRIVNYAGGFLLDALSFGYLTYVVKDYEPIKTAAVGSKKQSSFKKSAKDGLTFLFSNSALKWIVASFFVANIGFQAVVPMLTFLLKQVMKISVNMISVFFSIAAIASIIGNFIYLRLNKKIKLGRQLVLIGEMIGLGFALMLDVKSFIMVTCGYAIVSFGSVWSQANFFIVIQSKTPARYKGTITSIATSLTRLIGPVMSICSGMLVKYEVHSIFVIAILCMVVSVIMTFAGNLFRLD